MYAFNCLDYKRLPNKYSVKKRIQTNVIEENVSSAVVLCGGLRLFPTTKLGDSQLLPHGVCNIHPHSHPVGSVISIHTGFTVNTHGVLQAANANPSSSELSSNIQASPLIGHIFIIVTVFGFIVAIAF